MSSAAGGKGVVLGSLKVKMQGLRDELEELQDRYEEKCKECENLKSEKNQVNY